MFDALLKQPFWRLESASRVPYNEMAPSDGSSSAQRNADTSVPGETVVVSPDSYVISNINERVRLKDLMADERFRAHVPGLSFVVRRGDTGSWLESMNELKEGMVAFLEEVEKLPVLSRLIDVDMVRAAIEGNSHLDAYRRAVELLNTLIPAMECCESLAECGDLIDCVQRLRAVLEPMSQTMPPVRSNLQAREQSDAKAAFVVTGTEAGAELYMGLKGPIGDYGDLWERIVDGPNSVHPFLNIVEAKIGIHGVPEHAPYGASGGVQYVSITPAIAETVCVDEWHRCASCGSLWQRIDRLLTYRIGSYGSIRPRMFEPIKGDPDGNSRLFRRLLPNTKPEYAGHMIETPSFRVSWIPKPQPAKEMQRIFAQGSPIAMVVMYGAMSVKHPEGPEVCFAEGDACVFPANTHDLFGFAVTQAPAAYLMITNTQSASSLSAAFLQGMMGLPVGR